jgi:hypothetical protein
MTIALLFPWGKNTTLVVNIPLGSRRSDQVISRLTGSQSMPGPEAISIEIPKKYHFLRPVFLTDLVRIGRESDGGYLAVMDKIRSSDHVISFGIGMDLSFEAHLLEVNRHLNFQIFDHTVSKPTKKKMIKVAIKGLFFRDYGLLKSYRRFSNQYESVLRDSQHWKKRITGSAWFSYDVTAGEIFSGYSGTDGILKIDIEGSEYRILHNVSESINKFQLAIIEFHDSDLHIDKIKIFVKSIEKTHRIVHFHANNYAGASKEGLPEVFELTIMKMSGKKVKRRRDTLPLDLLDFPNAPHRPDFQINWA